MIEIIEMGKIPKEEIKTFRKRCGYCNTLFMYNNKDVNRMAYTEDKYEIKCPLCGHNIEHDEQQS